MNKWLGQGSVSKAPKTGQAGNGNSWARFTVRAPHIWWDSRSQQEKVATTYVNCVAWGKQADFVRTHVQANTDVHVIARYQVQKGQDGGRWFHQMVVEHIEVVGRPIPGSLGGSSGPGGGGFGGGEGLGGGGLGGNGTFGSDSGDDDDIPF